MTLVAAGVVPSQVWTLSCEHWKVRCLLSVSTEYCKIIIQLVVYRVS